MDIKRISIAELADEFIYYVEKMKELDMNLSSDFIATASYLMELKSRAILPKPDEEEEKFEKEKEEFLSSIEKYAMIKELVRKIEKKDIRPKVPVRISRTFGRFDKKLFQALKSAVESVKIKEKVFRVKAETLSVEEMMERILNRDFPAEIEEILLTANTRYELIVIVLAVLELIKIGKLHYESGRLIKYG